MRIEAFNIMNMGFGFKMPAYREIANCKNEQNPAAVGDGTESETNCGYSDTRQSVTLTAENRKTGKVVCTGSENCRFRIAVVAHKNKVNTSKKAK